MALEKYRISFLGILKLTGFVLGVFILILLTPCLDGRTGSRTGFSASDAPIIDRHIVSMYNEGTISKEAMVEKVGARLDTLTRNGEITGWAFNDDVLRFEVILTNGAMFYYYPG